MAYDQYKNSTRSDSEYYGISGTVPINTGYVSVRMKKESPIFSKQKMNLNLPRDIVHLTVSNNCLVCLMSNQVLLQLSILEPEKQNEVFLEKYLMDFKVSRMFLDPTGAHLLLSLAPKSPNQNPELLYLHKTSSKPKRIDKFRDNEITAVAFNFDNKMESSTGPILLGTNKGLIFETEFSIDGEKLLQNNWKQVFDIGRGEKCAVTGLQFFREQNSMRYIVLASTIDRLYKFHDILKSDEKPLFQNLFSSYQNIPEQVQDFIPIDGYVKYSRLQFNLNSTKRFPLSFGCLEENDLLYGQIDQIGDTTDFIKNTDKIAYPMNVNTNYGNNIIDSNSGNAKNTNKSQTPKAIALTSFHMLLLYSDHVTAVSILNTQIVYEEYFSEQYGKIIDIVKDYANSTIYIYTSKSIFRYKITNEQRNVWRMYLEKNEFELAQQYAKDNPAHLDIVLCKQAELYFEQNDHEKSALIYSQTQVSFERVCLKFLSLTDKNPLMIFLKNRLEKLQKNDQTQMTMLVVWLVELYLTEMSHCGNDTSKVLQLQKEFDNFMNIEKVIECVQANRSVIYDIMGSHSDTYNLTALTTINKDYEYVINQYITEKKFSDALSILRSQNKPNLYYKYCPILMEQIPHETISAIILQKRMLDATNLLPTLLCLQDTSHISEIIRYLEYAIYSQGRTEKCLHNFLVTLYAEHKQDKLKSYLETEGHDLSLIHYDIHYALRTCEEYSASEASVFLQCLLQMWYPAIELALKFNSKLAQETASKPDSKELKRKLWLKIAEHEIKGKNDVKKALKLLNDCDLLRIEDLLPFFCDFQKIDDFKDAICNALKDYNTKIQEQQKDMEESAKAAERVRDELQTFRNYSITIEAQDQCAICEIYLLLKPFFIFPCGHKFHSDCLEKQVIQFLTVEQNRKLDSLKKQLENTLPQIQTDNSHGLQQSTNRDEIKVEIENILASDCLFCGIMINTIDQPFIEDWDQVNIDWQ